MEQLDKEHREKRTGLFAVKQQSRGNGLRTGKPGQHQGRQRRGRTRTPRSNRHQLTDFDAITERAVTWLARLGSR